MRISSGCVAGPKKETERQSVTVRSISSIIRVGFRNTSFFDRRCTSFPLPLLPIPFTARLRPRARRRNRKSVKRARTRRTLTCPCCSAVPPLLDCSPWTDSCCCIHSSVSLQEDGRNGAMKTVCYTAADRSAKFLVGNGAPSSFFRRRDVNAIQRGAVYILRNAYEIALCSK